MLKNSSVFLRRANSLAVLSAAVAMLACGAGAQTCNFTVHANDQNIQLEIDTHGPVICFDNSRIYRLTTHLIAHHGQTLLGLGTYPNIPVLDGSVTVLSSWQRDRFGNYVTTLTQQPQLLNSPGFQGNVPVPCQMAYDMGPGGGDTRCQYNESVYLTNRSGTVAMPLRWCDAPQGLTPTCTNGVPNGSLPSGTYSQVYGSPAQIYLSPDLNPSGQTVDVAVADAIIAYSDRNVTIKNLIVQKAANRGDFGAIDGEGALGSVIKGVESRYNHGAGGIFDGSRVGGTNRAASCGSGSSWTCCNTTTGQCNLTRLNDSDYFHHNGQIGIESSCRPLGGTPPNYTDPTTCVPWDYVQGSSQSVGDVVQNNIVEYNNVLNFSAQYAAGGAKFAGLWNLSFINNFVFQNKGPGGWCDINCYYVDFSNNYIANNYLAKTAPLNGDGLGGGIIFEVSHWTNAQNNILLNNETTTNGLDGFSSGGLITAESSKVNVQSNTVSGYNGIGFAMNSSEFNADSSIGYGRVDWCGGGGPPSNPAPTTYPDGAPYCPTTNVFGQPIHDIRDQEPANCSGYSTSGSIRNCSVVYYNNITEIETDPNTHAEVAGLDTDMDTAGLQYYFKAAEDVYDYNTYRLPDINNGMYFTPQCGHQGGCTPFALTFGQWQSVSNGYGGQDLNSTP